MAFRRSFGEKVIDAAEDIKDKITGHHHDRERREMADDRFRKTGGTFEGTGDYGGQCPDTGMREGIIREPGVFEGETRQPGGVIREEIIREPGGIRNPGACGGQMGDTGVVGGPLDESGNRHKGHLYETGQQRNEF